METATSGGRNETDAKDVATLATSSLSSCTLTIVTPVVNRDSASVNSSGDMCVDVSER
jgi:hypothetical protein